MTSAYRTPAFIILSAAVGLLLICICLETAAPAGHQFFWYRLLRSSLEIITIIIYPGLALATSLTVLSRRPWRLFEWLSLASVASLLLLPALLLIETSLNGSLSPKFPYLNTIALALLAAWLVRRVTKPVRLPTIRRDLAGYLGLASGIYIAIITILAVAYPTLPDPDPYDWIRFYQNFL